MDPFFLIGLAINFIPFFSGNGMYNCDAIECNTIKEYYSSIHQQDYKKINALTYTTTEPISKNDVDLGSELIKNREGIKNILFQTTSLDKTDDFMFDNFITLPFIIKYNNGQITKQSFTLMKDKQQWKILISN